MTRTTRATRSDGPASGGSEAGSGPSDAASVAAPSPSRPILRTLTTRLGAARASALALLCAALALAAAQPAQADEPPIAEEPQAGATGGDTASAAADSAGTASQSGEAAAKAAPITLGWAELDTQAIGGSQAGILIPRQLMGALSFLAERWPSESEAGHAMARQSLSASEKARAAVAAARAKRDLAALTIRDPWKRASETAKLDEAAVKAEAALEEILASGQADAPREARPATGTAPIQLWKGHAEGSLLPAVTDPAGACEAEGLDLLVHGSIRAAGSFYALRVYVYVAATGETVYGGLEYAAPDGLAEAVGALAHPVAEALYGRPFSRATIAVSPPTATVTIDGEPLNGASITFLEGGQKRLKAEAKGYAPEESSLDVALGKDISVALELKREESTSFTLESEPSGAIVHLDGLPVGTTPMPVEGAGYSRIFRLSLEGFEDERVVAAPGAGPSGAVALKPSDGLSFDEAFDERKGRFYRSLGWFVSALPVAVLSGGLFQSYSDAAERALEEYGASIDPALVERLNFGFYTSQTAFWASAAATLGLAVNAAVRLAAYLAGADR